MGSDPQASLTTVRCGECRRPRLLPPGVRARRRLNLGNWGSDPQPAIWIIHQVTLMDNHFHPSQQREFRSFVEAGAGITRAPWKDAVGRILIGSEAWVERPLLVRVGTGW